MRPAAHKPGMPGPQSFASALSRQFSAFVGVGLVSAVAHYGLLIALVEGAGAPVVAATLAGYVVGGVISYALNRRYAFRSERPHGEATWRFALVAAVGFVLTGIAMGVLHGGWDVPYLLAQVLTTGCVMLWSFVANRWWTFQGHRDIPPAPL
jgi:putative flippase GtrA